PPYWEAENQDIVVLPSCSFDPRELRKVRGLHQYEERFLHRILHLARPGTRVIFVTSVPVDPDLVAYHLSLLPPTVEGAGALLGTRLIMVSVDDGRPDRCLARKFVEKPRLVGRVRRLVDERRRADPAVRPARLEVYRRTRYEALAARALGLELKGAEPELLRWGTKSGSRAVFADAGVPHVPGTFEAERDVGRLAERVAAVLAATAASAASNPRFLAPAPAAAKSRHRVAVKGMVKLEDGFAGLGNGLVDLSAAFSLAARDGGADSGSVERLVLDAFGEMQFQSEEENWPSFRRAIESIGAVFELFVPKSDGQTTPSVQAYIKEHAPTCGGGGGGGGGDADVVVLSTHEQILDGHAYGGCEFPAGEAYRARLEEHARAVGRALARRGEVGHFGVDFIATPSGSGDGTSYLLDALEINLRTTGTTCPLMMLKLLERSHDPRPAEAGGGGGGTGVSHGHYIAFDHFGKADYTVFTPADLHEMLADLSLARGGAEPCSAGRVRDAGILLYMHGAVAELGTFGIAFVGPTREDCRKLVLEVERRLDDEALRCKAAAPEPDDNPA
ncbi:MAG: hypothetical protein BJ554DRAFT_3765, partial [Olpidium bornovanus]